MEKLLLSMTEIERRFDSEWVLLANPVRDDRNQIVSGEVLYHGKDRDELDRVLLKLRPSRSAVLFTGEMPEDAVMAL